MDSKMVAALVVSVISDLFHAGRRFDDGSEMYGECFSVQVSAPDGSRWIHSAHWESAPCGDCMLAYENYCERDEGPMGCARHMKSKGLSLEQAECKAEILAARIRVAIKHRSWSGPADSKHWAPSRPCYGSEAYVNGDWTRQDALQEIHDEIDLSPQERARAEAAIMGAPSLPF